ncbi:fimbrial protein [Photorhabdus caribbeanensis]|uniref:fimbrial protein n=1 Tax=Photorhabdus caribbeanensis TaxID=1004165 RepID=UPI001FEB6996|nr:fimbrial protein [Photorhabdus caribbeanensis]
MVKFSKAGISRIQRLRGYLNYIGMGGVLWLSSGPLWAANSAIATFKADIAYGTCDIAVDNNNIDLGKVQFASLVSGNAYGETNLTLRNCSDVIDADRVAPAITITGEHFGTSDKTLFRSQNSEDSVSKAVGVTVRLKKLNGTEWSSNIRDSEPFYLADKGTVINAQTPSVPVRFSLVCAPAAGETIMVCKKPGKIYANVNFTFDYR